MRSPTAPAPRRSARAPRPSLSATVLRLTAAALVAAVLAWTVLFADLLLKRGEPGAALSRTADSPSSQPAQAPAPVTTRTS